MKTKETLTVRPGFAINIKPGTKINTPFGQRVAQRPSVITVAETAPFRGRVRVFWHSGNYGGTQSMTLPSNYILG